MLKARLFLFSAAIFLCFLKTANTDAHICSRMVRCSVLECLNKQGKCSGITFHKFPKDEARRQKWIEAVGRKHWAPTPSSLVCSSHFTEENMDRTSLMYVRLRQDAVPTVFTPLPRRLQKKARSGKQQDKQDVEHECQQNQQIEDNFREQNHDLSSTAFRDSETYEPSVGSVLLTTIKKESEQVPVSVLLEWSEVGTGEPAPGSPSSSINMDDDNVTEQKPSLADLLDWRNVGTSVPAPGLAMSTSSNSIMPQVQSVLCTPDTPCKMPLKRRSNAKATEPKRRKRKIPMQKAGVEDKWEQGQPDGVDSRAQTPEALLLECCIEEETCDSEQASSVISECSMPPEAPMLFTTDPLSVELLKKQLYQSNEQLLAAKKRIRILMQNRRRFQKRIASLKGTCAELKSKNLLNEDKIKFLERTLGGSYRELFERKASSPNSASLPLNYSTQLREFATKLYFYSRDAYHYMRQTFQNCLPHPGTLRRWNNPYVDCPPESHVSNEMSGESSNEPKVNGENSSALDENSACRDPMAVSSTDLVRGVHEDQY